MRVLGKARAASVGLLAMMAVVNPSPAADWQFTPRLNVRETYSDNINLQPSDLKRDDFVTQVTPGFSLNGTGSRLTLNFDYQATGVFYARDSGGSRLDNRLQGSGTAEVYEDHLFLDFSSTVSQRNINNQGRISRDDINVDGNRETVTTFQLSPYWVQRFGSYADALLRYNGGLLRYETNTNTNFNGVDLSLTSGTEFAATPWALDANYSKEDNNNGTSNTFRNVNGNIRYNFNRNYAMRLRGGVERNDIVSTQGNDNFNYVAVTGIWTPNRRLTLEVGAAADNADGTSPLVFDATWTPTVRTSVVVGYAPRDFGSSFNLEATHTMRRAVFNVAYTEDRTTTAQRDLDRQLFPLEDPFGQPIVDPGLQPVFIPIDEANVTDQTLISKRFNGGVTLRGRFTSISLDGYYETRDYELSGGDEKVTGFTASARRDLSRYGSVRLGGYWQRSRFLDSSKDHIYGFDVGYDRTFSDDLRASLIYSHNRNDSDQSANDYVENRVTASVTVLF